jgi:hypothetical protein
MMYVFMDSCLVCVSFNSAEEGHSFQNIVWCYIVTMKKVQIYINDRTYVKPLSKMSVIQ